MKFKKPNKAERPVVTLFGKALGQVATVAVNVPADFTAGFKEGYKPYDKAVDEAHSLAIQELATEIRSARTADDAIEALEKVRNAEWKLLATELGWKATSLKEFKDRCQVLIETLP